MISFIIGNVEYLKDSLMIIENNGIGYKLSVTYKTIEYVSKNRKNVKVFTFMNVKEDEISLYGFLNIDELELFEKLISVSGVGPKSAISLLNAMEPREIIFSIITSDINSLSKGQGIGKKTAQRIALELKDKVETFDAIEAEITAFDKNNLQDDRKDAIEALMALGFSQAETIKAISYIQEENISVSEMISKALKKLSS